MNIGAYNPRSAYKIDLKMTSFWSHVKPLLPAGTVVLVSKLISALFLAGLAIVSRVEPKSGQWFTPQRRIEILFILAIMGLVFQVYAITAERHS